MRLLLFTGTGGAGTTTAAAATAVLAAARGCKTLVLSSTGDAGGLAWALGTALGPDPTDLDGAGAVTGGWALAGMRAEAPARLAALLGHAGLDPEDLQGLPTVVGTQEVLALLAVREQVAAARFDLVVLDAGPNDALLRLLSLPDALRRWTERLWPAHSRATRTLHPLLGWAAPVHRSPAPGEQVLAAIDPLHRALAEVSALLSDPVTTSVRLVLSPEAAAVAKVRRAVIALALAGHRVDEVIANRVLPSGSDAWSTGWVAAQTAQLSELERELGPGRVRRAPHLPAEPVGVAALHAWAVAAYGEDDPAARGHGSGTPTMVVEQAGERFVIRLELPLVSRAEVDLARRGDDLLITVGVHRRVLALPSALRRCDVEGAQLRDGRLSVTFAPDPAQWLRSAP